MQAPRCMRTIDAMRKPPVIHAVRPVEKSRFLRIEDVDLEFSNGVRRTHERLRGRGAGAGAVIMVPMRDDNTVLLVREYGVGVDRYELGVPMGRLDHGETPAEGANREMQEEIGYGAHQLEVIGQLTMAPAYMTGKVHVVLARQLYPQWREGDEPEPLDVVPWALDGLHELLAHPEVSDGRSIAALFMTREFLAGRYRPGA